MYRGVGYHFPGHTVKLLNVFIIFLYVIAQEAPLFFPPFRDFRQTEAYP